MFRGRLVLASIILILFAGSTASAQVVYELYNEQGASAPCIGIGVGIVLAKKCVSAFEKAGFVPQKELGSTGLTLGEDGTQDGAVTGVAAGSPAAAAGIAVGDVVVRVDDRPTSPTPDEVLAQRGFGARGQDLHVKIRREGREQELVFAREPKEAPAAPKGEGMMTRERPLINWRGQFAPCIGFGPGAILAFAYCDKHFAPFGFVPLKEFSSAGFAVDAGKPGGLVSIVDADSPAAQAGLRVGDEIASLDGKPLSGSAGANAKMLLFGKAGQTHRLVVRHGSEEKPISLTLAPRQKGQEEK